MYQSEARVARRSPRLSLTMIPKKRLIQYEEERKWSTTERTDRKRASRYSSPGYRLGVGRRPNTRALFLVMAGSSFLVVTRQGTFDDRISGGRRLKFVDFHDLSLELLVVLKKTADHRQLVRRQFAGLVIRVVFRVGGRHRDDLVVQRSRIDHGHQADGARVHDGERHDRDLAQNQNVERIVILRQRLRNEAIVCGINHCGIQHPIHADDAAGFIQFVLHARTGGNFNNGVEFFRNVFAGTQVMPGMHYFLRTFVNQGFMNLNPYLFVEPMPNRMSTSFHWSEIV